jgi:hypothetical protein
VHGPSDFRLAAFLFLRDGTSPFIPCRDLSPWFSEAHHCTRLSRGKLNSQKMDWLTDYGRKFGHWLLRRSTAGGPFGLVQAAVSHSLIVLLPWSGDSHGDPTLAEPSRLDRQSCCEPEFWTPPSFKSFRHFELSPNTASPRLRSTGASRLRPPTLNFDGPRPCRRLLVVFCGTDKPSTSQQQPSLPTPRSSRLVPRNFSSLGTSCHATLHLTGGIEGPPLNTSRSASGPEGHARPSFRKIAFVLHSTPAVPINT